MKNDTATDIGDVRETRAAQGQASHRRWRRVMKVLLLLLILSAGITGAFYINKTTPKARKRPPQKMAPLVQTETVHRSTERVIITAMGTVIPALKILLKSQVAGELVATHSEFTEGGFLKKGVKILQIDPEDYKLAIAQKQSNVANASYGLKIELGHQDVAKREWELLKGDKPAKDLDFELALRKPHLEKAKADLAAAEAELKQAQLNLARTTIRAPFNSIIRTKNVDMGSQVTSQDQLAELVGTDEYWIQVSLPVDRLKWITVPRKAGQPGSRVRILYGKGAESGHDRAGSLLKLLSDLGTEGRMARVLVSVKDPLDLKKAKTKRPPLLISGYVRVEIEGHELEDVFRIPRSALRDNANLWIAGNDGRLHIRNADIVWRDARTVLLRSGLNEGERLILSDLATPVEGMGVRIAQGKAGTRPGDASPRQKSDPKR